MTARGVRASAVLLLLALGVAALPMPADAHGRSLSWSSWRITSDGAFVRVRVPLLELTRIGVDPRATQAMQGIARQIGAQVQLMRGGSPCEPVSDPLPAAAPDGQAVYEWRVRCTAPGALVITSTFLLDEAPSHLHFVRLETPDGSVRERVLSDAAPSWALGDPSADADEDADDGAGTGFAGYLALGVEHIATGWDHLAFVLALLLLAASFREVAALVTAFTVAHSVTLALAVLGVVRPEPAAVEALIGFSIALVAAENGWLLGGRGRAVPWTVTALLLGMAGLAAAGIGNVPAAALVGLALFSRCHFALLERSEQPARLRAAVAFAFGLIHGFGFAGILAEMDLPTDRLVPALLGFNIGVELGQLAIVAIAWPALRGLARLADGRPHRMLTEVGSAAVCGLGLFWFVTRSFG